MCKKPGFQKQDGMMLISVLKQLEVIFLDGVADHCAKEHISWDPVPAIPQFGELA